MHNTWLNRGLRPNSFDCVAEPGESVSADNQHVEHATVTDLGEDSEPIFGSFVTGAKPQAKYVFRAFKINGHCDVDRPVDDPPVGSDLHHDRI